MGIKGLDYEPLQTTPNKRTWALFGLALVSGLLTGTKIDLSGLSFFGMILFYLAASYTWYRHNEDVAERNKVLDAIEQL